MMATKSPPKAIFVTAADHKFSRSLYQLLLSAKRRNAVSEYRWIAYDMGIQTPMLNRLKAAFPWCEFRHLSFDTLPPHYTPSKGTYAWKPHVVWDVVKDAQHPVCWLDSATVIRGDIAPVIATIRKTGFYVLFGQTEMTKRCDPSVMTRLAFPQELWHKRECFAGIVGLDPQNSVAKKIGRQWCEFAEVPEISRPQKITSERHMNDQAILSCLVLPLYHGGVISLSKEDIDISSGSPIRVMSSRNKVGTKVPFWMDPIIRAKYAIGKYFDQWAHRLKNPTPK